MDPRIDLKKIYDNLLQTSQNNIFMENLKKIMNIPKRWWLADYPPVSKKKKILSLFWQSSS